MITDEALERWLSEAGSEVALPADGLEQAMAGIGEPSGGRVSRRRVVVPLAAAAAVAAVAILGTVTVVHHSPTVARSETSAAVANGPKAAAVPSSGTEQPRLSTLPLPAAAAAKADADASGAAPATTGTTSAAVPAPRVVRTATVDLQVKPSAVAGAIARVRSLVASDGGYVQSSKSSLAGTVPTGTVTLRIPSADYARVRNALASGGYGTVASLQENGADVTAQYVDLGAQITALTATRASYLALLAKAHTVSDILNVQGQLSGVQEQLQSLQGQQKQLASASDDASVTVTVGPPSAQATHHRSGWSKALGRAGHGVVRLLQGLLAASGVAAVGLVAVLVLGWVLVVVGRRVRRRLI